MADYTSYLADYKETQTPHGAICSPRTTERQSLMICGRQPVKVAEYKHNDVEGQRTASNKQLLCFSTKSKKIPDALR